MTACVFENVFCHEFNAKEVARQEYEMAKEHFREVMKYRVCGNPEHEQRFRDATDRQETARERFVKLLTDGE